MGEDAMFAQRGACGLWRREGVRGAGTRNSERDATRSREGRLDVDVDVDVDVVEEELLLAEDDDFGCRWVVVVLFLVVVMLGVRVGRWREVALRLLWNQLVTAFTSLKRRHQPTCLKGNCKTHISVLIATSWRSSSVGWVLLWNSCSRTTA